MGSRELSALEVSSGEPMSTSLRSTPIPWTTGELRLARELRRARWSYGRIAVALEAAGHPQRTYSAVRKALHMPLYVRETKQQAEELRARGWTLRAIARVVGAPRSTVASWCRRWVVTATTLTTAEAA